MLREAEFQIIHKEMSDKLEIVGFLEIAEVASPATVSRHLVLPISTRDRSATKAADSNQGSCTLTLYVQ